tara:strand:+ start:221 stop:820 length:600 start_codon:yes stop_codon:yes gene_type:complete
MSLLGPLPNKKKKTKRDSIGRKKRSKSKSSMSRLGLNTSESLINKTDKTKLKIPKLKSKTTVKSKIKAPKQTQKDKDDARKESELASLFKKRPEGGYSKSNTKDPGPGVNPKTGKKRTATLEEDRKTNKSKPKKKKKSEMNKEEWLKATRNSPAAKAGFDPEERWEQQQKHRKWKADRAAGKHRKKNLTNAEKLKLRRR